MSCLGGSGNIFSCKIYVLSLENHNEPAIAKEDIFFRILVTIPVSLFQTKLIKV